VRLQAFSVRWSDWLAQACRYWLPLAAYAGLIFYLSSLSHPEVYVPSLVMELGDKILHAIEYGVLGILFYRVFRHAAGRWSTGHALLLAIAASAIYGLTDELHQAFVPLREADGWDLLMDALGAGIGAWSWHGIVE
jgi:VanZ family protein